MKCQKSTSAHALKLVSSFFFRINHIWWLSYLSDIGQLVDEDSQDSAVEDGGQFEDQYSQDSANDAGE